MFKTILSDVESVLIEKKSKFITNIYYVESEEEAENKIKEIRKKYHDAKHHCFAYNIYSDRGMVSKFSDDGEPSRNGRESNAKYTYCRESSKCASCGN